jgi:glycosyltransferase involved in cell wall biosynthesis
VERLAAAQVRLLKDEALARKFGERGRERVEKTFSLERMPRETIAVYREAIA